MTVNDWGVCCHCGGSHPKARLRVQRGRCHACVSDTGPYGDENVGPFVSSDQQEEQKRYRIEQRRLTPLRIRQHGIYLDPHFHDTPAGRNEP